MYDSKASVTWCYVRTSRLSVYSLYLRHAFPLTNCASVARPARALRGGSGRARRGRAAEAGPCGCGRGEAGRARAAAGRALAAVGGGGVRASGGRAVRLTRGVYICSCRATDQGATLPRHGRWRDRTRHVSGPPGQPAPRQPCAAPPCMARHRHLAASGQ